MMLFILTIISLSVFSEGITKNCGKNEVFNTCGSACEPSCENPNEDVCDKPCIKNVCQCKKGYLRNKKEECVRPKDCPKGSSCANFYCPREQICIQNPLPCLIPPCPLGPPECVPIERAPTCLDIPNCPDGTTCHQDRDTCKGKCCPKNRPEPECIPNDQLKCEPFAEFFRCGSDCEPTCENQNRACFKKCVRDVCQCIPGYVRDENNRCLAVRECPVKTVARNCSEQRCRLGTSCRQEQCQTRNCIFPNPICFPNEPFQQCPDWFCPEGQKCQQDRVICLNPNCLQTSPKCVANATSESPCITQLCPYGTKCVEFISKCPNQKKEIKSKCVEDTIKVCNDNEFWDSCNDFEATCENPKSQSHCTKTCVAKCVCKKHFVRKDGRCVHRKECAKGNKKE